METEITVQVFGTLSKTLNVLKDQGFIVVEKYRLIDYYFSPFSQEKVLKEDYAELIKNSFLVRNIQDEKPHFQICYKHKKINSKNEVVAEEKIVTKIDDYKNALKTFKSIGLNNWAVCDNTSYILKKGEIVFSVQDIKNLGVFIEYEEDESMKHLSLTQKREEIKSRVKNLGLNLGDDFSCKKVFMLLHK